MSGIMLDFFISALMLTAAYSYPYPYRSYSARSVPGRLRARSTPDYFTNYNLDYRGVNHDQYGIPEYGPLYTQSRNAQISPETAAAILAYLSQNDYSYGANNPQDSYTDDEGTWYDNSPTPLGFSNDFDDDGFDRANQNQALLQFYLDHFKGKYSLEDLEMLDREAAMEDNTENELQAYRKHKKSSFPVYPRPPVRKVAVYRPRQGQKEEAYMVPATSVRKIPHQAPSVQQKEANKEEVTSQSSVQSSSSPAKKQSAKVEAETTTSATQSNESTTMDPFMQSAHDALVKYLNTERRLRQLADETDHMPKKRFVSDPASLSQQLEGLKKTVT